MREEVTDENTLADVGGQFRKPAAEGVVDGKAVIFFEEQDGHGGELLGDGGHAEIGTVVEHGRLGGKCG